MKEKFLTFLRLVKHKISKSIKWHSAYFSLKYRVSTYKILNIIFALLKTILVLGSFCFIIIFSKIILFNNFVPYFNINFTTEYITKSGILGTQITLTLICVSLIALIANIDKKYIYGERLLDLAFPSKILSFKNIMFILFGLLLSNVFLMLKGTAFVYIIFIFLITAYLAIIVLYRFASVFLSRASLKNKLFCKYYKSNVYHMRKTKPLEPYIPELLSKLKSITLKHLNTKNYPELNENMILYFDLLKSTLFNKSKMVQEYYTEYVTFEDLIGHINEFAISMIYEDNSLYGLQIYNTLLRHINYYKVICINRIVFSSQSFIEAFVDLSDKTQIKAYLGQLLIMSDSLITQTYLYSITDLSYCRLAKDNHQIFYFAQSDMYEKIYNLIISSKRLTNEDKDELFEDIRTHLIDLTGLFNIRADIETFKSKKSFLGEKRKCRLDIKGEPIAKYFIKLIEHNDFKNLNNYKSLLFCYKGRDDYSANFAIILSILSVFNNLYNKGKRQYLYDIDIKKEAVKELFKKCEIMHLPLSDEMADEFYSFIISHYIINMENQSVTPQGGYYHFHPKFSYKKEVVDTIFAYLFWKNQNKKSIEDIAKERNLLYQKTLGKTIFSFCLKNKK